MADDKSAKTEKVAHLAKGAGAFAAPGALFFASGMFETWPLLAAAGSLVGGVIASVATGVWDELKNDAVRGATSQIRQKLSDWTSRAQRKYFAVIAGEFELVDVLGASHWKYRSVTWLDQVFVDLALVDPRGRQGVSDPVDRKQLWDYLADACDRAPKFALIGEAGAGKTTLTRQVALTLASGHAPRPGVSAQTHLPIWLPLRVIAEDTGADDATLPKVAAHWAWSLDKEHIPKEALARLFERRLRAGKALVLLDGMDEVPDREARVALANWIDAQMRIYEASPFVVTSREDPYAITPLRRADVLKTRPFTLAQAREFIDKFFLAQEREAQRRNDRAVTLKAARKARDLFARLRNAPRLAVLTGNPLLLTLIAYLHMTERALPGSRAELYDEICAFALGKRREVKKIASPLNPAQERALVEPLAWRIMIDGSRSISMDDAKEVIGPALARMTRKIDAEAYLALLVDSGLATKRDERTLEFAHLSFQEFLAAAYASKDDERKKTLVAAATSGEQRPWWRECALMFAAANDASDLLRACLERAGDEPEMLALALDVEAIKQAADDDLTTALFAIVEQGLADRQSKSFRIVASALLERRLQGEKRPHPTIDHDFVTSAEYQLFVEAKRDEGEDWRPIHWAESGLPPPPGAPSGEEPLDPALGMSLQEAEAFVAWANASSDVPTGLAAALPQATDLEGVYWTAAKTLHGGEPFPRGGFRDRLRDEKSYMARAAPRWAATDQRGVDDRALDRDLALDLDLARDLVRARALARDLALARARDLDLDLDLARDLDNASKRITHAVKSIEGFRQDKTILEIYGANKFYILKNKLHQGYFLLTTYYVLYFEYWRLEIQTRRDNVQQTVSRTFAAATSSLKRTERKGVDPARALDRVLEALVPAEAQFALRAARAAGEDAPYEKLLIDLVPTDPDAAPPKKP